MENCSFECEREALMKLSELYKVFGNSVRLRILYMLGSKEMSVFSIAKELSLSQSEVSHQLKQLREQNLVKFRRDGKSIIYSISGGHVLSVIGQGLEHIEEFHL